MNRAALVLAMAFAAAAAHAATPMVSSSSSHTLALKADGTVVAWGTDREGALGTGRPLTSSVPVKVAGLPKVVSIVGRNGYVLAIDGAGRVWSWGNPAGPLGPRGGVPATAPGPVAGVTEAVMVSAGVLYATALRRDGTVLCWGRCPFGTTPLAGAPGIGVVTGLADIAAIAAGDAFLALKRDGTVLAMGPNNRGSVGDGTRVARTSPVAVPGLSQVVAIAAGEQSVALRADGTVYYWGSGGYVGVTIDSPLALAGLGGPAISIASDGVNTAVRNDGTVWTWNGSLALAQQAGIANARKAQPIDAAGRAGGTLAVLGNDAVVRTVGGNSDGELGTGSTASSSPTPSAVPSLAGVVALAGFRSVFLALTNAGEVWSWGFNGNLLGNAVEYDRAKPFAIPGLSGIVSVAAGQDFSLALRADGQVYSWGKAGGARGRPGTRDATPTLIPGLTDIKVIAAGWDHSLFVRGNGRVLQSGNAYNVTQPYFHNGNCATPCQVLDGSGQPVTGVRTDVQSVAAGSRTSFAILATGRLIGWGATSMGELGYVSAIDRDGPIYADGGFFPVIAVSTQLRHTLAIAEFAPGFRVVVGWGQNAQGQVGVGNATNPVPQTVLGNAVDGAVSVSAGWYHSLAVREDGQVLAWGNNFRGELGDGTTTQRSAPVTVLDLGPQANLAERSIAVSAGEARSFALRGDGLVHAWGTPNGSGFGNLADGTFTYRRRPVVAISEYEDANLDDAACTNSPADRFWYLDLQPASCAAVPAAKVPTVMPITSYANSADTVSVGAELAYRRADFGTRKKTFVLGAVPAAFLDVAPLAPGQESLVPQAKATAAKNGGLIVVQLTPAGWSVVSGPVSAYVEGITEAERRALKILESVPPAIIPGAQFCVGYGDSVDQMLSSEQLRVVATIPGTDISVGLPCLLSGTYLNGPPASLQGEAVQFTASVVGQGPTGTVQFKDGAANLGPAQAIGAVSASLSTTQLSTTALAPGDHAISVAYSGDANPVNPASASGTLAHRVMAAKAATSTQVAGPATSLAGAAAAFTATVAGSSPTGTVVFRDGAAKIGEEVLAGGVARLDLWGLAAGTHSITAEYAGDGGNLASASAALGHQVFPAAIEPWVSLAAPATTVVAGAAATFVASVAGNSPTGTVSLHDGPTLLGSAPLVNGAAAIAVTFAGGGLRSVQASYSGDGGHTPAQSAQATVNVAAIALAGDDDGDGIPNGVEAAEGRDALIKDNDVFASPRLFVRQQYRDFLGREGEEAGIAAWVGLMNAGTTPGQVVNAFFNSVEFDGFVAPVVRLYYATYLRVPDYAGLVFNAGLVRNGTVTLTQLADFFTASPEFAAMYGSLGNAQFVTLLYNNVLGRSPDAAGLDGWVALLQGGMSRGQVLLGFSESVEYRAAKFNEAYVTMMYVGMLRRSPEPGGYAGWLAYLQAGNTPLAMIDGFRLSTEYRGRFLP